MKEFNIVSLIILSLLIILLGFKYNKHNSSMFATNPSMKKIFMFYCVLAFIVIGKLLFNVIYYYKIDNTVGRRGFDGSVGNRGKRGKNAYCKREIVDVSLED